MILNVLGTIIIASILNKRFHFQVYLMDLNTSALYHILKPWVMRSAIGDSVSETKKK